MKDIGGAVTIEIAKTKVALGSRITVQVDPQTSAAIGILPSVPHDWISYNAEEIGFSVAIKIAKGIPPQRRVITPDNIHILLSGSLNWR
jgi:hypothetical protein